MSKLDKYVFMFGVILLLGNLILSAFATGGITLYVLFIILFGPQGMGLYYIFLIGYFIYKRNKIGMFISVGLSLVLINICILFFSLTMSTDRAEPSFYTILDCLFFPLDIGIYLVIIFIYYTKQTVYRLAVLASTLLLFGPSDRFAETHIDSQGYSWLSTLLTLILPFLIMIYSNARGRQKGA